MSDAVVPFAALTYIPTLQHSLLVLPYSYHVIYIVNFAHNFMRSVPHVQEFSRFALLAG